MGKKLTINGANIKPHQHTVYHDEHGNGIRINYGESVDVERAFNSDDLIQRGIATLEGEARKKTTKRGGNK